jgi:hypothetical protein
MSTDDCFDDLSDIPDVSRDDFLYDMDELKRTCELLETRIQKAEKRRKKKQRRQVARLRAGHLLSMAMFTVVS